MKKQYEAPDVEIEDFEVEDITTGSTPDIQSIFIPDGNL
jgi:hypothetical protein